MNRYEDDIRVQRIRKRRHREEQEEPGSEGDRRAASSRKHTQEFRCRHCSALVGPPLSGGRERNHCPVCLTSVHLDETPGDRASLCRSVMEPIAIWVRDQEWVLLHRCRGCGAIRPNRIAADDNEALLISLAVRAIGRPAFPLYTVDEGV